MKKTIIFVLLVCMLCSLCACDESNAFGLGKRRTPEDVAGNFILALFTPEPEMIVECVPAFMLRQLAASYGVSPDDKKEVANAMNESLSDDDTYECVILSVNRDDTSSVLDEYKYNLDNYGVTADDLAKIEDYCMVNVEATIDNENTNLIVFCVKYDGVWCAVDID